MSAAAVTPKIQTPLLPIPEGLSKLLHTPKTPWQVSPALFERMTKQYTVDNGNFSRMIKQLGCMHAEG